MLEILKTRFDENMNRHPEVKWETVAEQLSGDEKKVRSVLMMEESCGEPDVIEFDGKLLICDCSRESPRKSLCYDEAALFSRKKNPPDGSAVGTAEKMSVSLMTEEQYRYLQTLGEFDLKTSSWVKTPEEIRRQGGAIFCDRRYGRVFTFHNGADSYYSVRGFRAVLEL